MAILVCRGVKRRLYREAPIARSRRIGLASSDAGAPLGLGNKAGVNRLLVTSAHVVVG
jgi:hypothetical protein